MSGIESALLLATFSCLIFLKQVFLVIVYSGISFLSILGRLRLWLSAFFFNVFLKTNKSELRDIP